MRVSRKFRTVVYVLLVVMGSASVVVGQQNPVEQETDPCTTKQTCGECIQMPTCSWCSHVDYSAPNATLQLPRCKRSHLQCPPELVNNPVAKFEKLEDTPLSKGEKVASGSEKDEYVIKPVQITPQRVSLKLRINEPYDLAFSYAQAEDYPVDLYYLLDMSKTMEDDKATLSKLGESLAAEMRKLTSNFRLGFGSFVDKVALPFTNTVPSKLQNPCDGCTAPYGFRHHMSLAPDGKKFAEEVRKANVSGNIDAPEGGFDAIMQAVVCTDEIGWRPNARRLLVFSSDGRFHYAGDGKLAGIVTPNDGKCHLENGEYTHSTVLDYPSVSHMGQKVQEHQVNLIFAVTEEQLDTYLPLAATIPGASARSLSSDSNNIVTLIKEEYQKITSSIEMRDNATGPISVTYYSRCGKQNSPEEKTSKCDGLKIHQTVDFTAKIMVSKCPEDPNLRRQTIKIEPIGVNELLIIDLEMQCDCDCEKPGNSEFKTAAAECNEHGELKCGVCDCHGEFSGRSCECNIASDDTEGSLAACTRDNQTQPCSGHGKCECGQCKCEARRNGEAFYGTHCECDNFSCPRRHGVPCSGPEHGMCECGKCRCMPSWTGDDCSCSDSGNGCVRPGDTEPCSGRGKCSCNECLCDEAASGSRYSGKYCQRCNTCPGRCEELKACVQCKVFKNGAYKDDPASCAACKINIVEIDEMEEESKDMMEDKRPCEVVDEDGCLFRFAHPFTDKDTLTVHVRKGKTCPPDADVLGIVIGVVSAVVAVGLILIVLWKVLTTIHDRREFAKFEEERRKAKWNTEENPIFVQPVTTITNPMFAASRAK